MNNRQEIKKRDKETRDKEITEITEIKISQDRQNEIIQDKQDKP
jgi:hypothetical protein